MRRSIGLINPTADDKMINYSRNCTSGCGILLLLVSKMSVFCLCVCVYRSQT